MNKVVENLEWMGYSRESIKGIGKSIIEGCHSLNTILIIRNHQSA